MALEIYRKANKSTFRSKSNRIFSIVFFLISKFTLFIKWKSKLLYRFLVQFVLIFHHFGYWHRGRTEYYKFLMRLNIGDKRNKTFVVHHERIQSRKAHFVGYVANCFVKSLTLNHTPTRSPLDIVQKHSRLRSAPNGDESGSSDLPFCSTAQYTKRGPK